MASRWLKAVIVATVVITAATACSSGQPAGGSSQKEKYKVGGVFALTGPLSNTDNDAAASLRATVAYLNATGGVDGHQLEYQILDSQSDPSRVQLAVRSLLDTYNPQVVVPDIICTLALAGLPVTNSAKMISFTGCDNGTPSDPKQFPYNFSTFAPFKPNAIALVSAAKSLSKNQTGLKVGEIYSNDASGTSSLPLIKDAAQTAGMTWVGSAAYQVGAPDLTVQLSQLRSAGAQVIFMWGQTGDGGTVMKGIVGLNWKDVQILGSTGIADASLATTVPADYQKQFHVLWPAAGIREAGSTKIDSFLKDYLEKQSITVQNLAVVIAVHDGLLLWKWAVERAHSTDPEKLRLELEKLSTITNPKDLPKGLLFAQQPNYGPDQHGLSNADMTNVWGLMQPSKSIEGTYEGTPFVMK